MTVNHETIVDFLRKKFSPHMRAPHFRTKFWFFTYDDISPIFPIFLPKNPSIDY